MNAQEFIEDTLSKNTIVLFMKGTAQFPQCGFSSNVVETLKKIGVNNLATVNVLDDQDVRQGIKDFSNWPTIRLTRMSPSWSCVKTRRQD